MCLGLNGSNLHGYKRPDPASPPPLRAGASHFLALTEHPRASWNDLWLLTEIHHQGKQPQLLEESVLDRPSPPGRGAGGEGQTDNADFTQGYRNTFSATPRTVPYRPNLEHPKPRIRGSQSAVVTGPAGGKRSINPIYK